jgi:hypothetical protein
VIKRLFTVFRKSKDSYLQRWVPEILARYPALREPAFQYLRAIGYSRRRFQDVIDFVRSDDCLDDASLFGAARLVVDWALPLQGPSWREAVEISFELPAKTPGRAVGLCAAVWVLSKYGADEHLSQIVHQNEGLWRASEWASRLIAAATVRMNVIDAGRVTRTIASYGLTEGSAVLIHLQEIEDAESAAQRVRRYVQHDHSPHPYPIYKVLITLSIMRSRLLPEDRAEIGRRVIDIVADPWYKRVLARELMRIEQ